MEVARSISPFHCGDANRTVISQQHTTPATISFLKLAVSIKVNIMSLVNIATLSMLWSQRIYEVIGQTLR